MSRTPCLIPREDSAIDTRDKVKYIFYNFKIFNLIYLIFSFSPQIPPQIFLVNGLDLIRYILSQNWPAA